MSLAAFARQAVEDEKERREELRRAVAEAFECGPEIDGEAYNVGTVRRHLALFYGDGVGYASTLADLIAAFAIIGGVWASGVFVCVKHRRPSFEARKRVAVKWNKGLPKPEAPPIRRLRFELPSEERTGLTSDGGAADELADVASLPAGTLYRGKGGVYRQVPPEGSGFVNRDGGVWNKRGVSVSRKRRFPAYLERIRDYLETAKISAVDRTILEHVANGQTLQWIADEMGMKKPTVFVHVRRLRQKAGIAGPGRGR